MGIALSASAVGKAGMEYEWSVTKGRMSPMKMIEVFVIPSIDLGSKLIFRNIWVPFKTLKILNSQPLELPECFLGPFKGIKPVKPSSWGKINLRPIGYFRMI